MKQAKNPCLVGLSGIIIYETENAFRLITQKNLLKRAWRIVLFVTCWTHTCEKKVVPKQGTIFSFRIPLYDVRSLAVSAPAAELDVPKQLIDIESLPQMEFELYGNQFRFRSAERAGRKFKAKETIEL